MQRVGYLERMLNVVDCWAHRTGLAVNVDVVAAELYLLFIQGQQSRFDQWWVESVQVTANRLGLPESWVIRIWQEAALPGPQPKLVKKQEEEWLLARPQSRSSSWWARLFR